MPAAGLRWVLGANAHATLARGGGGRGCRSGRARAALRLVRLLSSPGSRGQTAPGELRFVSGSRRGRGAPGALGAAPAWWGGGVRRCPAGLRGACPGRGGVEAAGVLLRPAAGPVPRRSFSAKQNKRAFYFLLGNKEIKGEKYINT